MRKNISGQAIGAQLINKGDGSNVTTGTTTVYVTGDAGTQAIGTVGSGLATHEGNGFWTYAPSADETNFDHIAFAFVNTLAVTSTIQLYTTTTTGPTTVDVVGATATTSDFNVTRNELIEMAYEDIKVKAEGESLTSEQLTMGIKKLNLIIREYDEAGKHLWAVASEPTTVPLVANTFRYTTSNGLPSTILKLVTATYRTASQEDLPLKILTTEQYEREPHKLDIGEPEWVYLTEHRTLSSKVLYLGPTLSTVNTQSVVTGTDATVYRCIRSHTADSTNQPVTGVNALLYWEAGGSSPGTWTTGTSYTAPQLIRLWFRRPLYDFDSAADNPDMPQAWSHWLQQELAIRLSPGHNVTMEKVQMMRSLRNESYERVFRSIQPTTTEIHDKVQYF